MRFLTLGVGDAFSARWYSSALALEAEGAWLLLDCPHPIRKILREASERAGVAVDVGDLAAVAVTHLHADHASGLEGLGYYAHFVLQRRVTLVADRDVAAPLWDHNLKASMGEFDMPGLPAVQNRLEDYFDLRTFSPEAPLEVGPFRIESRRTIHPIPTTAFRVTAGGRTLGCSADTAFDASLIAWLGEADLVIHETNVGIHTPYEALAALPAATRAKMRLIHYPDEFDLAASVIEPLEQGRLYEVTPGGSARK